MNIGRWSAPTGSEPTFRTPGSYYLFGCRTVGNRHARGVVSTIPVPPVAPLADTPDSTQQWQRGKTNARGLDGGWGKAGELARWATDSLTIGCGSVRPRHGLLKGQPGYPRRRGAHLGLAIYCRMTLMV